LYYNANYTFIPSTGVGTVVASTLGLIYLHVTTVGKLVTVGLNPLTFMQIVTVRYTTDMEKMYIRQLIIGFDRARDIV